MAEVRVWNRLMDGTAAHGGDVFEPRAVVVIHRIKMR
jgi:hypothetical protein